MTTRDTIYVCSHSELLSNYHFSELEHYGEEAADYWRNEATRLAMAKLLDLLHDRLIDDEYRFEDLRKDFDNCGFDTKAGSIFGAHLFLSPAVVAALEEASEHHREEAAEERARHAAEVAHDPGADGLARLPFERPAGLGLDLAQGEGAGSSAARSPWRVAFELGELDPRLRLAPCQRIQAYLPAGARLWGRTRVGLRCEQGPVRWNVFWPVTVRVWGQAVVAAAPLRPGEPLTAADLKLAEVDLAAEPAPAVLQPAALIGRSVTRALEAGHALRTSDVRPRRWFALGDTVTVNVLGDGFHVQAEGRAMAHGDEGQCARIRAENGRTVCAMPVGERLAELRL